MNHMNDPMKYDDSSEGRKATPVYSGVVRYFPAALALVSKVSKFGSDKHGTNMQHKRGVSADHGDCVLRHQMNPRARDPESNLEHACAVAWRALAQLQEIAEREYGWPAAPAALFPVAVTRPDPANPKRGDLFRFTSGASEKFELNNVYRVHAPSRKECAYMSAAGEAWLDCPAWSPVSSDYTGPVVGE